MAHLVGGIELLACECDAFPCLSGQVVLSATQYYWTMEVEDALESGGAEGVKGYHAKMLEQLKDLSLLVRQIPADPGRSRQIPADPGRSLSAASLSATPPHHCVRHAPSRRVPPGSLPVASRSAGGAD